MPFLTNDPLPQCLQASSDIALSPPIGNRRECGRYLLEVKCLRKEYNVLANALMLRHTPGLVLREYAAVFPSDTGVSGRLPWSDATRRTGVGRSAAGRRTQTASSYRCAAGPPPRRGGRGGEPGGGPGESVADRLWRPTRRPASLAEADAWLEEQLALALAYQVANGSLYLWADDRRCEVGFRLDEPAGGIERLAPLGELLEQAVYRNLPPDPGHRQGYRFRGRGLAEMSALREVLA